MKGFSQVQIRRVVARDVERVREHAAVVLTLYDIGSSEWKMSQAVKTDPRISVIAVVGPGYFEDQFYKEALLCEIGISRGRPYRPICIRNGGGSELTRRKWFSLTKEQYLCVAPAIFALIQQLVDKRVTTKWRPEDIKYGGFPNVTWYSPKNRKVWHKPSKGYVDVTLTRGWLRGGCFSISPKDLFLVQDILHAEMFLDPGIQRRISKFAGFVRRSLKRFWYKRARTRFSKLMGAKKIGKFYREFITLPRHLQVEAMLRHFRERHGKFPHHPYWDELCELIGWNGEIVPKEIESARNALLNPGKRLNGIKFRIIRERKRKRRRRLVQLEMQMWGMPPSKRRKKKRRPTYLVIEVFPSMSVQFQTLA